MARDLERVSSPYLTVREFALKAQLVRSNGVRDVLTVAGALQVTLRFRHGARMEPELIDPDIGRARTLPAYFYRDPAVFERLREKVFARSWQLVDGAGQVSANVLPFTFLEGCVDEPLLLTRGADGALHGLSNVCTHRGNLVCTEAQTVQSLRCRYHGRRFALDGRFLSMPEFEDVPDFPSPADDLPRIRLGRLGPLVFAAIDAAFT